ncbi:MAG: hypothetical protein D4R58_01875 [Betaproteobacteria bacterium]|nr:MAG: hypothetical protein D4R58_01875 [Betaproteobacteria bacterium]
MAKIVFDGLTWAEMSRTQQIEYMRLKKREKAAARAKPVTAEPAVTVDVEEVIVVEDAAPVESREDRRARLLAGVDAAVADLITDDEIDAIEATERDAARAERKKQALATVKATLRQEQRVDFDLISPDVLRSAEEKKRLMEPVRFKLDLPGDGAGHNGRNSIKVNGFPFVVGVTYVRPRAVADTVKDIWYRAWLNEMTFRTLDQQRRGGSAKEVLARMNPRFEVAA